MIDHISIPVSDLLESASFYDEVLEPLGLSRKAERANTVGFGKNYPEFWLNFRPGMGKVPAGTGAHVCLRAPSKDAVTNFYERALSLGGESDGAPGDRIATVTTYFGAFIRDPDGNKIEVATFPRAEA